MTVKRYRKLPVEIEAVQWTGDNLAAIQAFVGPAPSDPGCWGFQKIDRISKRWLLYVAANRSWLPVEIGEWVAKDSAGFYPIKSEIFIKSYEEVS